MVKLTAVGGPVLYSCHLILLLIGVLVYVWLFLEESQIEILKTKEFWSLDQCKSCYLKAFEKEIGDDELSMSPCACFFKDTQSKAGDYHYPKECSEKQTLQTCRFSNGTQVVGVTQHVVNTTCVFWKEVSGMTLSAHSNVHATGTINLADGLLYLTIFFALNLIIFIIMLYRAKDEYDLIKISTTAVMVFLVCSTTLIRGIIGIYYHSKETYGDVECYKMLIPNEEDMRSIVLAIGSTIPGLFLVIWIFWVISMCRFPCEELACPITPVLFIEIVLCIYCFVYIGELNFYIIVGVCAFEHLAMMVLICYKRRCRCPCCTVSEDKNTFRTRRSSSGWYINPVTDTEPFGTEAEMTYPVVSGIGLGERWGEVDYLEPEGQYEGQSSLAINQLQGHSPHRSSARFQPEKRGIGASYAPYGGGILDIHNDNIAIAPAMDIGESQIRSRHVAENKGKRLAETQLRVNLNLPAE